MSKQIDFFLSASSPRGFVSFFDELSKPEKNDRLLIIKGGPGTGKSSLMRSVAGSLEKQESLMELIHCSSDPDSLDGVVFHDLNASMIDGTAPHTVEPNYPGCFEAVINLFDLLDNDKLYNSRERVIEEMARNKACHKRCQSFLQAAKTMLNDSFITALSCTDSDKIARLAKRIALKEFSREKGICPVEHKRFLSGITPKGLVCYTETAKTLCDRIYIIQDDYGVSSSLLLSALRAYALSYGHEIYSCYCPLSPGDKLEHLFIPALGLGFMTRSRFLPVDVEPYRVIHFSRFTDMESLKQKKQRLNFNRKAAAELILEASLSLQTAKAIHDRIEEYYIAAVNFSGMRDKAFEAIHLLTGK